jgi:hypothetical protein
VGRPRRQRGLKAAPGRRNRHLLLLVPPARGPPGPDGQGDAALRRPPAPHRRRAGHAGQRVLLLVTGRDLHCLVRPVSRSATPSSTLPGTTSLVAALTVPPPWPWASRSPEWWPCACPARPGRLPCTSRLQKRPLGPGRLWAGRLFPTSLEGSNGAAAEVTRAVQCKTGTHGDIRPSSGFGFSHTVEENEGLLWAGSTVCGARSYASAVTKERLTEIGITLPSVAPPGRRLRRLRDRRPDRLCRRRGDAGRHTRTAAGTAERPFDVAVEIEMTARVRD